MGKKIAKIVGIVLAVLLVAGGGFVFSQVSAFDSSMATVYDTPAPAITAATDPEAIARGKHVAEALGACAAGDCHGPDLSGGNKLEMGPLGTFTASNITVGGKLKDYTDGEVARLIRHGIRRDGTSVRFMPVHEHGWLPDRDIAALLGYLRSLPASDKPDGPMEIGLMAKVLDRQGGLVVDVARKMAAMPKDEKVPDPAPTAEYGAFIGRACTGCHGDTLAGGPIPGAPPELPVPLNITPHETGLAGWTFEDFDKLLSEGVRKNGSKLDPFMPLDAIGKADATERRALWAWLQSLPAKPFGER